MHPRVREIIVKQVSPLLPEGEVVRHLVMALRGESAWAAAWTTIIRRTRLIVATDNAILLLSSPGRSGARELIMRLGRDTRLGEPQFSHWAFLFWPLLSWRWIRLNNERLWIETKDVDEIHTIDAGALPAK